MGAPRQKRQGALHPLLTCAPKVYVGPRAERALQGERGVLLGAQRPGWIDVLEIDTGGGTSLGSLVDHRFWAFGSWDRVGLSLSAREVERHWRRLLTELVPGDVLLSGGAPLVHMGDRWEHAPLVCERGAVAKSQRATSARRDHLRR